MDDIWQLIEECRKEGLLDEDGGLDWDLLVSKDDIHLFNKYKDVPVSGYETFLIHLKHTSLKQQVAYFIRYDLYESAYDVMADQSCMDASDRLINEIEQMVMLLSRVKKNRSCSSSYRGPDKANIRSDSKLWDLVNLYDRGLENESKKHILFENIIDHKSPEFFELACKDDCEKITWALNKVSKTNFDAIDILLKHGGKVITSIPYNADDAAWYGVSYHDEVDEVATEILRLEIEKLRRLRE